MPARRQRVRRLANWRAESVAHQIGGGNRVDFDRILDHLAKYQVENLGLRIREIIEALNVLEHNLMTGRPVVNDKRELVTGRRSQGYVALNRYLVEVDTVLALRGQRESGYADRGGQ